MGCSVAEVKNAGRMPALRLGPGGLSNELKDGVGGAIDGSGGAEAVADFGEVRAHGFAGCWVAQQLDYFFCDTLGREVALNQLGNYALSGD